MDRHDMYYRTDGKPLTRFQKVESLLHQISNLNKVGAAAMESDLKIPHLDKAHDTLHEVIHRLASEALEHLEKLEQVEASNTLKAIHSTIFVLAHKMAHRWQIFT
ncbi:MAG: hypothetical protein ABJN34_09035 [Litoreibacter sp.]|uniref:hypothetical protein n=1 Tax=Litoreibacter sp. TaxID=1969459 RepID=UPI00329941B5